MTAESREPGVAPAPQVFGRSHALALVNITIDMASYVETDGDSRPVSVCVMLAHSGVAIPVAAAAMDGVKLASVIVAHNKCYTALTHDCNTADFPADMVFDVGAAKSEYSRFCAWDGCIRVYDQYDRLVCVLAVSGRSPKGDRILAVNAAHHMGYRTDFNQDGLTEKEAEAASRAGTRPVLDSTGYAGSARKD